MTLKKEIEDILHPNKEELHPPRAPISGENSVDIGRSSGSTPTNYKVGTESTDSKPIIDFSYLDWSYLANNSSFQRGVMEFIKKNVPGLENIEVRGSKEAMATSFNKNKQNYLKIIKDIKSGNINLVKKGTYSNKELGIEEEQVKVK